MSNVYDGITYHIKKLSDGYMVKCSLSPEIAVYGNTKEEALSKIDSAIDEFTKLFPDRAIHV